MKHALVLLLASGFLSGGLACKRSKISPPDPSAKPPLKVAPEPAAITSPTPSATPAPAAATGITQSKPGASENNPLNAELTNAVSRFRDKHKRLPASWQELVQTGFLKAMPTPLPGVRYALDPISAMVVEIK